MIKAPPATAADAITIRSRVSEPPFGSTITCPDSVARRVTARVAPRASFVASGPGGGNGFNLSGSSLTKTVKMNGAFNFHFDEALLKEGQPGYVISRWDEI